MLSEIVFEFLDASGADAFAVEVGDVLGVIAKDAGGMVFLEDDAVVIGEDLDGVLDFDIQCLSNFDRKHDSAKLVYFSDHSC